MLLTLQQLAAEIDRLAAILGRKGDFVTYGANELDGRPGIEIDHLGYHWTFRERGQICAEFASYDLDQFLYRVFDSATSTMASDWELKHRVAGQDSRRLLFERHAELLAKLSPDWERRFWTRIEEILREHPYGDHASERAQLTKQYRDQGHSDEVAWQMACERYPKKG